MRDTGSSSTWDQILFELKQNYLLHHNWFIYVSLTSRHRRCTIKKDVLKNFVILGLCISRPSALYLAPSPQLVFTCPGPQFVSTSPGSQLMLPTMAETLHLPTLVAKLYLPTLIPDMARNLYLPVQEKILLLLPQLLALSLPLLLPPPLLLQLLLLPLLLLKIITRDAFVAKYLHEIALKRYLMKSSSPVSVDLLI